MNHNLFLLLLFALPVNLHGQDSPELFFYSGQEDLRQLAAHSGTGNVVRVDLAALANSLNQPLTAVLPDNRRYEVRPDPIDWREEGAFKWVGQFVALDGEVLNSVITVKNEMAAGVIFGTQTEYRLIPIEPGLHRLEKIDQATVPECGGTSSPHGAGVPAGNERGPVASPVPMDEDSSAVIDVLVVYTEQAKLKAWGTDQIQVRIQNAIDFTNEAYLNSGVDHQVRLVASSQVSISGTWQYPADFLRNLKLDPVTDSLRDSYGADLVALVTAYLGPGVAGYASLMTKSNYGPLFSTEAYSLNLVDSLTWVLPHEMGHNMGLAHDPQFAGIGKASTVYPYAFGHKLDGAFRTIMAYPCTEAYCPRIQYFSNPNLWHKGNQLGIFGERDNCLALDNTASVVEGFRSTASCPPVPPPAVLYYPTESAIGDFYISWSIVDDAAIYTLQRSSEPSFAEPTTLYGGPNRHYSEGWLYDGSYYYRVRSENCGNLSEWIVGPELKVSGTLGEGSTLLFPYSLDAAPPFPQRPYSGVAAFNPNQEPTDVEFRALGASGQELQTILLSEIDGYDVLPPLGQVALLPTEIFDLGYATTVLLKGTSGSIEHFFMLGDYNLNSLDGVAGPIPVRRSCYFPIARSNSLESTFVVLTNSNQDNSKWIWLHLYDASGEFVESAARYLPGHATLRGEISDIFSLEEIEGSIRVEADEGIKGFEIYSKGEGISALAAQPREENADLIAPHYFVAPDGNTELQLTNTGNNEVDVVVRGYENDGTMVGEASFRIGPRSQFVGLVTELLPITEGASSVASGYLRLHLNGVPIGTNLTAASVLGTITFTGFGGKTIATLPCARAGSRKSRFLHIAQSDELNMFTGLAILNLSGASAKVTLKTYDSTGTLSGQTVLESLASGTRVVELLNSPNFLGTSFQQVGGHIEVTSDHPLVLFALFGDYGGNFLAAIEGRSFN